VLRITTYERLSEYLEAFAAGHFHLLILVGTGGLAKSRSVRSVLGDKGCWIEGNATPFSMYVKLYRHRASLSSSTTSMPSMSTAAACGY
jgi:hypothetical protein